MAKLYQYRESTTGLLTIKGLPATSAAAVEGDAPGVNSSGKLDISFMPPGMGIETKTYTAFEALSAGDFVRLYNDAGTYKVAKADANLGLVGCAIGFVLAGVAQDATATVYMVGTNSQLTSLTPNTLYYLSGTAGGVTATPPTASGDIIQALGKAVSTTEIRFEFDEPVTVG